MLAHADRPKKSATNGHELATATIVTEKNNGRNIRGKEKAKEKEIVAWKTEQIFHLCKLFAENAISFNIFDNHDVDIKCQIFRH